MQNRHKRRGFKQTAKKPPKATLQTLGDRLHQAGVGLPKNKLEALWAFDQLLIKRNHDRDLTRLIGFETVVSKHYIDSLIVGNLMALPSPLLDIGTGAGFPGIPLKIRYPKLDITLAEPRPRRVQFLNEAIQMLGLKQISVFDHKVVSRSFQTPMAGVITRALETMDKTILRTSACLGKDGLLIFLKGPNVRDELAETLKGFAGVVELQMDKAYDLPGTHHKRRLIVLRKIVDAQATP